MNYWIKEDGLEPFELTPIRLFNILSRNKVKPSTLELEIMQELINSPNVLFIHHEIEKDIIKKKINSLITGRLILSEIISKIPKQVANGKSYVVYRLAQIGTTKNHNYFVYVMTIDNNLLQKIHREAVINEFLDSSNETVCQRKSDS